MYDVNQSGDVTVEDVTTVVDKVKANVAVAQTQQYVTAEVLTSLFSTILDKLKTLEERMHALEAKVGIEEPTVPQQAASFEVATKSLKVGETYTQNVTSSSDGSVSYFSSNPSVATVDTSTGLVTAVADGEAIITAVISASSAYSALAASYTVLVEEANMHNGHEYVDLGLPSGTKWAKFNIGATNIYDCGDYFAWGETTGYNSGKNNFSWITYKYYESGMKIDNEGFEVVLNGVTKYAKSSNPGYDGFFDDKTFIEPNDDAATVNWGDGWYIPSQSDWDELKNKCTWIWVTLNGVNGYKVSGTNGNYIFIPAAGWYDGTKLSGKSTYCSCWSSSLGVNSYGAYNVILYSSSISSNSTGYANINLGPFNGNRCFGRSVRPVFK